MTDHVVKRVASFFMSQRADRTASYLTRGRKHHALSDTELCTRWVEAYRVWAADVSNPEALAAESDLEAEFDLRSIDPPIDLIREEQKNVSDEILDSFSDPDEKRQLAMELLEEIEAHERSAN